MKKNTTIALVIGVVIGVIATLLLATPKEPKYVCSQYTTDLSSVEYIESRGCTVDFYCNEDSYFFNVTIKPNSKIDYSGYSLNDKIYFCLSFDGIMPYCIHNRSYKYFDVPLKDGRLKDKVTFTISSEDDWFSGEDLEILNQYLNHEIDSFPVSVMQFDPAGIIQCTNVMFIHRD